MLLLARWLNRINVTLQLTANINRIFAWSDSKVALSWLTATQVTFKVFVTNRVSQIHMLLPNCSWSYVSTDFNPADCASRGMLPSKLREYKLYWQGPHFLYSPVETWPLEFKAEPECKLPEIRLGATILVAQIQDEGWLVHFSSYSRLLRVLSWVRRFIDGCKKRRYSRSTLSISELRKAVITAVKYAQFCSMKDLVVALKHQRPITNKMWSKLSPFIDDQGVVRVGGRLQNANLREGQKHPLLLSKESHLALLICRHWHVMTCHSGPRLLVSLIMQQFWIMSVRVVVRKVATQCVTCVRLAANNPQPKMADLPAARVQQCNVFDQTGVDFAGPFQMKETSLRKSRQYKVYVAVFICLSVKAVHLEVVTDLSTDAFLAALNRFVARRGVPNVMYSDCGTNFVGAANILRSLINSPDNRERIEASIPAHWSFNPPSAPHFGGIWEAAVRSMKSRLIRVICNHVLTYEEFVTIVTRVEAVLNSRPLTPLTSDPHDLDYLSPGHFLIGRPLLAIPETDLSEAPVNNLKRWKLIQQSHQSFWKLWSRDYLHTLQQRTKWTKSEPNILIGDMVIIKQDNTSPLVWKLGRVVEVFPSRDNVVRIAKVLTVGGDVVRPIVKLVPLPKESDN